MRAAGRTRGRCRARQGAVRQHQRLSAELRFSGLPFRISGGQAQQHLERHEPFDDPERDLRQHRRHAGPRGLCQRNRCQRHRGLHRQSCGRRWRCGDCAVRNQSHIPVAVARHHERSADRDGQQYRNCRSESHRADIRWDCQRRICAERDLSGRHERRRGWQLFAAGDIHSRCVGRPQCDPDDLAQCSSVELRR